MALEEEEEDGEAPRARRPVGRLGSRERVDDEEVDDGAPRARRPVGRCGSGESVDEEVDGARLRSQEGI